MLCSSLVWTEDWKKSYDCEVCYLQACLSGNAFVFLAIVGFIRGKDCGNSRLQSVHLIFFSLQASCRAYYE